MSAAHDLLLYVVLHSTVSPTLHRDAVTTRIYTCAILGQVIEHGRSLSHLIYMHCHHSTWPRPCDCGAKVRHSLYHSRHKYESGEAMVESKGSMMIATSKTNLVTCVITVNNMQKLVYASVGRATAVRQLCDSYARGVVSKVLVFVLVHPILSFSASD